MKSNWFYFFIAFLFFALLWVSQRFFTGGSRSSVGIAYSKEYKITAEKPSLVKHIAVVAGQQVKTGDLLVELTSTALEVEIDKMNNRILALKSEQVEKMKLLQSETAYVMADYGVKIEELNSEIVKRESEWKLNKKLTGQTTPVDPTEISPVEQAIEALKIQKSKLEESKTIRARDIAIRSETEQLVLKNQISLLEREFTLLVDERKSLIKLATADGVVDNIFVKASEHVDAYTPLLSVRPIHPTTVVGYLVGRKDQLPIGEQVFIRSYDDPSSDFAGRVIGYGSMVALPEILQKSTAVKAFGREVFIEMTPENPFASGEKVLIR